jgi:hypothetical protein
VNYKTVVKDKLLIISKSSDIVKVHSKLRSVHFRKYVSAKLIEQVLEKCPRLERISFSAYAYSRLSVDIPKSIDVVISQGRGRHSVLDKLVLLC